MVSSSRDRFEYIVGSELVDFNLIGIVAKVRGSLIKFQSWEAPGIFKDVYIFKRNILAQNSGSNDHIFQSLILAHKSVLGESY